jgi:hypothetical protein
MHLRLNILLGFYGQDNVYCVLCWKSGRLEIYDLPRVTCVFAVDYFNHGMSVLWDQKVLERRANTNAALKEGAEEDKAHGDDILRESGLSLHVTHIYLLRRLGGNVQTPFPTCNPLRWDYALLSCIFIQSY